MNSFDNFVVGEKNCNAYRVLNGLSQENNPVGKHIFIVGPVGSGKTHLLEATGENLRGKGVTIIYDSAIRFTEDIISSDAEECIKRCKVKYGEAPCVLILDDVQILVNREKIQDDMIRFFEYIKKHMGYLVIASLGTRTDFSLYHEKTKDYIVKNTLVDLQAPDYNLKEKLVKSFLWESHITIERSLLERFVDELPDDIRAIRGYCNKLNFALKLGALSTVNDVDKLFISAEY